MKFVFKLTYTPLLSPGPEGEAWVERSHDIHIFLSRDLVPVNNYGVSVIDVTHKAPKKISVYIADDTEITDTSGIAINAYCRTWAPQGYECKSTCGSGFLYIQEIAQVITSYYNEAHGSLTFGVALCEHTSRIQQHGRKQPVVKGRVTLMLLIKESELGKKIQIDASPYPFLRRDVIDSSWRRRMLTLCQNTIREINDHFLPSEPAELMERIRCPFYENDVLVLPGSAYVHRKPRRAYDITLFDHLLRVALRRHGITAALFAMYVNTDDAFFNKGGYQVFSTVVAHMLSALAWSLPYLTDFVNANRHYPFKSQLLDNVYNEHYKLTLIVLEGDCEGLAWLTNLMADESQLLQLQTRTDVLPVSIRVLQLLQRHYVPMLVQGAVSMGSAADTKAGDAGDNILCHTFQILMPLYMVRQCLERVQQKVPGIDAVRPYYSDDRESVLEVILNEGTGPCAPLQLEADDRSHPLQQRSEAVDRLEEEYPLLRSLQRILYRHCTSDSPQGFSVFYKSCVTAYSSYFLRVYDIPSLDICFVRSIQSTQTYGITAKELFSGASTNALYMFNRLDRQLVEGITVQDVMTGVFQRLEPVPLVLPPSEKQCTAVTEHVNSMLQNALYDMLPSQAAVSSSVDSSCSVTYYCRLDNLNNELLHVLFKLRERGALLHHSVVPLATTELQLQCAGSFPITSVDITINLSVFET